MHAQKKKFMFRGQEKAEKRERKMVKRWHEVSKMIRDKDYGNKVVYRAYVDFEKYKMPELWMAQLQMEIKENRPRLTSRLVTEGRMR